MLERELSVIDHRIRDHTPKVSVFTDSAKTPLTPAAVKRHRFIQNIKTNHLRFIESLAFVERFAAICELSDERINAIRKAKDEAIEELTVRFKDKLKAYDDRIAENSV